jgi:hypothetical protein
MSKSQRNKRRPSQAAHAAAGRRLPLLAAGILLAVAALAAGGYWWNRAGKSDSTADFQTLQGRWQRADGGYVIDIRNVDPSGKLAAGYFNPRPINVAKAEASRDGETVKVFIELRDANYPGSTYNLIYIPADDRLTGTYFQAIERATYDVYFTRLKP